MCIIYLLIVLLPAQESSSDLEVAAKQNLVVLRELQIAFVSFMKVKVHWNMATDTKYCTYLPPLPKVHPLLNMLMDDERVCT